MQDFHREEEKKRVSPFNSFPSTGNIFLFPQSATPLLWISQKGTSPLRYVQR